MMRAEYKEVDKSLGHIMPDSNFGQALTRIANFSNTIVEIGCWRGDGSARCLASGLIRPEQRMWSVDIDPEMIAEARSRNPDERITFLCGTVLKPEECDGYNSPLMKTARRPLIPEYNPARDEALQEMRECAKAPCVFDQLPEKIDLLLLDGGDVQFAL